MAPCITRARRASVRVEVLFASQAQGPRWPDPTPEGRATRPPFPLGRPGRPWMEQSLARIGRAAVRTNGPARPRHRNRARASPPEANDDHQEPLGAAAASAVRSVLLASGGAVERVASHLDAVDTELLRLGRRPYYVYGRLPGVLADDQALSCRPATRASSASPTWCAPPSRGPGAARSRSDRRPLQHGGAAAEARRQVRRLSSFTRVLYATAVALTVGAICLRRRGVWRLRDKLAGLLQPRWTAWSARPR